jgi:hypothetical protein
MRRNRKSRANEAWRSAGGVHGTACSLPQLISEVAVAARWVPARRLSSDGLYKANI